MEETSLNPSTLFTSGRTGLDRSVLQNPLNLQTSLADQLCGSPGTKQPEAELLERGRKGEQVGLVVHREESWG